MSFLSVDIGSSRCKAGIFSATGEMLGLRSVSWTVQYPQPGRAEINPDVMVDMVAALVRQVAQTPRQDPVQAVCFSAHGETFIPTAADGRACYPAILNMDGRAGSEAARCDQQISRERLFSITGHTSHAMYPVPKLVWLRKHAPEVFAKARWFLGVTDYLLLRLGLPPLIDYSHAARFMALDVHALEWSPEVLALAGVRPDSLATPVPAGTVAGCLGGEGSSLLGVPVGTPVIVGGHDQVIGALGMGVIGAGRAAGSLGTYECVLAVSDQPQLTDAALRHGLSSYPHAVAGKFVTIAYFPSGIMLEWLGNLLGGADSGGDRESLWKILESEAPEGPTGLIAIPHLIGSCNPEFDPHATGVIRGLTPGSTRGHLYKGVLEGMASELALIAECLESAGAYFKHINVAGGGTRSAMGLRLRAAFTEKHLHVLRAEESVCLGGALLASIALGVHADADAAVRAMVHEERCVHPDSASARLYKAQYARYRNFRTLLMHFSKDLNFPLGEQ